jgi:hypothetical protein
MFAVIKYITRIHIFNIFIYYKVESLLNFRSSLSSIISKTISYRTSGYRAQHINKGFKLSYIIQNMSITNNNMANNSGNNISSIKKRFYTKKRTVDNIDVVNSSSQLQEQSLSVHSSASFSTIPSSVPGLTMKIIQDDNQVIATKNTITNNSNNNNDVVVAVKKQSHLTQHEFKDLSISANTKKALAEKMKYQYMTAVQHESLPEILKGHDVLVKAKTGTGKTLGFLIPAIEVLIKERSRVELAVRSLSRDQGGGSRGVGNMMTLPTARILVLSPTRELAQQIVQEASNLCSFHNIGCVLLVGGTNMNSDVRALSRETTGIVMMMMMMTMVLIIMMMITMMMMTGHLHQHSCSIQCRCLISPLLHYHQHHQHHQYLPLQQQQQQQSSL